jgi:predicted nucleic acid-binding protein
LICVDASVAVKWILEEERSDRADALYDATVNAGRLIIAPPLLPLEVTNILRQRMRGQSGISPVTATELLDAFLALPIEFRDPADLHHRALVLADALGLPATYDALPLAGRASCLRTLDGRSATDTTRHEQPALRALDRRSPGDRSLMLGM